MDTLKSSNKDILSPKHALLKKKVILLQSLFKKQFKRNICRYKTNDFLIDNFEPSATELKSFVTRINGKELKHQVSLHWEAEMADLHVKHSMNETETKFHTDAKNQPVSGLEPTISFSLSTSEMEKAVRRAVALYANFGVELDALSLIMDLSAAKHSMPEIHFKTLIEFKDVDFVHDVSGIQKNLNRETGLLGNHFLPRCARFSAEEDEDVKSIL